MAFRWPVADLNDPVSVAPGEAEHLAAALGDRATFRSFTAEESAAAHADVGASVLMNGVVFDWPAEIFHARREGQYR